MPKQQQRFIALVDRLQREYPDLTDPGRAIAAGSVRVNGVIISNPKANVPRTGALTVQPVKRLRGAHKLQAALNAFGIDIRGQVVADIGASTGGFTSVLLEGGARRVYAVDAGHGQLLGSLRQDLRVVNLERTNLGSLSTSNIPEALDLIAIDVSYLALAEAVPQLRSLQLAPAAHLIALVKPMYELHLARPPETSDRWQAAVQRAGAGLAASGWVVADTIRSPVTGSHGAIEFFVLGIRSVIPPRSERSGPQGGPSGTGSMARHVRSSNGPGPARGHDGR